jgi:transposase
MVTTRHRKKYTPEFREEAVRMVLDSSRPIAHVARDLGLKEGTLGNWVNAYRKAHGPDVEPELTLNERARLRELGENRELKMKAEFLVKAAAFFAQEYR